MEEDDFDFTPTQSTSSNLASLFGLNKKPIPGNSSLTYTAPKAPKKESCPLRSQQPETKNTNPIIICSKAVQVYRLENRNYINQGIAGIALSKNHNSSVYGIILYNHSKEHICNATITKTFSLTLLANNYVSFYDNKKQNWSVLFQTFNDLEQFVEKLAISKFYCHPGQSENILIQDLMPNSNVQSHTSSTVEITYNSYGLSQESASLIKENIKEKIDLSDSSSVFAKGLIDCSENSKRIIIVPYSLSVQWAKELAPQQNLLIKVKIEKIISQVESLLMSSKSGEGIESPVDSSTEEMSVKTKTASIREVIANTKSQKANLISRMARMGQATLPLKHGLPGVQSDSEEDGVSVSSPKPRTSRSRIPGKNASSPLPETAKQVSVYQNEGSWPQMQLTKYGMAHQIIPVSNPGSSVSPTTDSSFSVYMSESRIQAAEFRMNISKISDKIDLVIEKVQNLNVQNADSKFPPVQDSSGILVGVQSLIAENAKLKAATEEQKKKIEMQNDRIFHLLELNQKYLEQNSTSIGKQSETELKLRKELEGYLEKDTRSKEDCRKYDEKIKTLQGELIKSQGETKQMREANEELKKELNKYQRLAEDNQVLKRTVEAHEQNLRKASEIVGKLKKQLRETLTENEGLKSVIEAQRENLNANKSEMEGAFKTRNEEHEKAVKTLEARISEEESKHKLEISDLNEAVKNLRDDKESLQVDLQRERENHRDEMKKIHEELQGRLVKTFSGLPEYSSSAVLSGIKKCFEEKDEISANEEPKREKSGSTVEFKGEVAPVPAARLSIWNAEVKEIEGFTLLGEEKEASEDEPKNSPENEFLKKKADENYQGNNSYDQRWRTDKPPPPPLFDDEDDDDWLN